jgi:cellulose synthase/poly-beta-1,6-N-acetylglucosamine synthase-like glycosyltransferase
MINTSESSTTHLVLVPSYNTGPALLETVKSALQFWRPVWVIVDGSTDASGDKLKAHESELWGLKVISLPRNRGKEPQCWPGCRRRKQPDSGMPLSWMRTGNTLPTGSFMHAAFG